MSEATGTRPASQNGFEGTVRDFWTSRPRRPRRGRKVAGVAAGIGDRYGIDPVIVRVALIVATVLGGGLGVLLYLLGWLLLPQEGDEVSGLEALVGKGRSSMSPPLTIGLCFALFPASGWAFSGSWFAGGGFVMLGLIAAGLFVLHRGRGSYNRPVGPVAGAYDAAPAAFHAESVVAVGEAATGPGATVPADDAGAAGVATDAAGTAGTAGATGTAGAAGTAGTAGATGADAAGSDAAGTPLAWDPLGAAPFAWDLPEPGPAPISERPPRAPLNRSPIRALTYGLALVTAGVGTVLNLFGVEWFTVAHIIGLTLAVLGLGMVIAAFTGGGRRMTWLAAPLAIAGIVLTSMPFGMLPGGGWGQLDAKPTSASEVQSIYQRSGGEIKLDLTDVPYTPEPISTEVRVGMGRAEVIVPEGADVTFTCSSHMGNVDCLGLKQSGMDMDMNDHMQDGMQETVRGTDNGRDGIGGQKINLDVSASMGEVVVTRD